MKGKESESLKLLDRRDAGDVRLSGVALGPILAEGSALSVGKQRRSIFERCSFTDVQAEKCVVGFPIFRECIVKNLRADMLRCYGALFLQCTFRGNVRRVTFGLCPEREPIDELTKQRIVSENDSLLRSAKYCLDVREAILSDVGFDGEGIASRVLFGRGQCAIYRATDLSERLERLRKSIGRHKDRAIQMALFSPLVFPGESLQLVSMETCGATERIGELSALLQSEGIDLIDEPLIQA